MGSAKPAMDGYSWASRRGRDRSTIETCLGGYVSFASVSWLLEKLLAGAERVPRESERHTKEHDSFAAGGALLYVRRARNEGCGFGGVEHGRKERRGRQYLSPGLGRDS
jgi:hypothetical protein